MSFQKKIILDLKKIITAFSSSTVSRRFKLGAYSLIFNKKRKGKRINCLNMRRIQLTKPLKIIKKRLTLFSFNLAKTGSRCFGFGKFEVCKR